MKRARFTEEQIIAVLKEDEAGPKTADLARRPTDTSAAVISRATRAMRPTSPLTSVGHNLRLVLLAEDFAAPNSDRALALVRRPGRSQMGFLTDDSLWKLDSTARCAYPAVRPDFLPLAYVVLARDHQLASRNRRRTE